VSIDGDKLAYSPSECAQAIGIGRTKVYRIIADGKLPARKLDGRTLVLRSDLEAYLDQLPRLDPLDRE
jgi:excisionase family DNA binding protein